jgi:hypothetical protein
VLHGRQGSRRMQSHKTMLVTVKTLHAVSMVEA